MTREIEREGDIHTSNLFTSSFFLKFEFGWTLGSHGIIASGHSPVPSKMGVKGEGQPPFLRKSHQHGERES